MTLFFSGATGAFYDDGLWSADLPADIVEVTPQVHAVLMAAVSAGKILQAGPDGAPAAVDPPSPSMETLAAWARRRRDAEIAGLRYLVERHRDELALGLTTTLTAEDFRLVLEHIQALRDVPEQAGFPEAIHWPALAPELLTGAD
jgi:Phage tail assembly chaperone protein